MPGSFGFLIKEKGVDLESNTELLLNRMAANLRHLETYKSDQAKDKKVGIGIIDVNSIVHRKIYVDPATGIIISLSGQVFDYIGVDERVDLSQEGQSEKIILRMYFKYGINTPEKLNGDFNIALYDPRKRSLIIFNDRFGYRHLYYYDDQKIFMFAPESKAFVPFSGFDKKFDEQGISDYFTFFYCLGDRTMFKRIKLLPPASVLSIDEHEESILIKTYWEPKYSSVRGKKDLEECIETGYGLFCQSMQRRTAGWHNVVIPLSGGLDSRLICATAKDLGCNITTATMGIPGCSEHKIATMVCDVLNLPKPHLVNIQPEWLMEFANDLAWINECNYASLGLTRLYGFSKVMGLDYDCFLNGIFGGHLSFGSPYFEEPHFSSNYTSEQRTNWIITRLNGQRYVEFMEDIATPKLNDIVNTYREKSIHEEWERTETKSTIPAFRYDSLLLYNRMRRAMNSIDQNRYFFNDQLPFSSYELYDFYLTLSPELLLGHYLYKEIYKKKLPQLARIKWQSTGVNLYETPSSWLNYWVKMRKDFFWYTRRIGINLYDKTKEMHDSQDYLSSAHIKQWVRDIILSERFLNRGYFYRDGLIKLLNMQERRGIALPEISQMVIFELWARNFID